MRAERVLARYCRIIDVHMKKKKTDMKNDNFVQITHIFSAHMAKRHFKALRCAHPFSMKEWLRNWWRQDSQDQPQQLVITSISRRSIFVTLLATPLLSSSIILLAGSTKSVDLRCLCDALPISSRECRACITSIPTFFPLSYSKDRCECRTHKSLFL